MEGQEVIRMSTRAEIRQKHLVEGMPLKEVARRLGVNIKTVRRHVKDEEEECPPRASPRRGRLLDPHREEIEALVRKDGRITAKRIGRILEKKHKLRVGARSLRRYLLEVRGRLNKPEVFVHRTHLPGETMEIDFGEGWAIVGGERVKIFFFVATLPASNAYFAKAYRFQRVECLLDGITSAFLWFGGLVIRLVFDNASMAVRKILKGEERIETQIFHTYRASWPVGVDFCGPAKGNEKGSVERGVEYVRGIALRPIPEAADMEALNEQILHELEIDLDRRKLPDGRTAREALDDERKQLRSLPNLRPDTGRVVSVTADKHGHVRIDRSTYSVQEESARRTLTARLYHDQVKVFDGTMEVAKHKRSLQPGTFVLELEHILRVLEKKPRAASEATVIRQLGLPQCFEDLRQAMRGRQRRKSDKEWVQIIGLLLDHPLAALTSAVEAALERDVPDLSSVRQLLRNESQPRVAVEPVRLADLGLDQRTVAAVDLEIYGSLSSWIGAKVIA